MNRTSVTISLSVLVAGTLLSGAAYSKDKHDDKPKHHEKKDNKHDSPQVKQSFNEWRGKTGTGEVMKGSPYHKGPEVDIDGKKGDKVGAFRGGKVEYAGPKGDFGNTVIVKDKRGDREQYSHLDRIDVKSGQKVKQNQRVGAVGTTGNVIGSGGSDGSHLHYQQTDKKGKLIPPR